MSETTTDPTSAAGSELSDAFTRPEIPDALSQQIDVLMDLDQLLDSARLVERTETVCVAGDLLQAYDERIKEMASLVDADGKPREDDGDASLADVARVEELHLEVDQIRAQMDAKSMRVLFRAMDSADWEKFDKARRGSDGRPKNQLQYEHDIIAAAIVEIRAHEVAGGRVIGGSMTPAEVETKLRKKLTQGQFVKLYNAAYFVNTADGVDVPKLPSFWPAQKLDALSPS